MPSSNMLLLNLILLIDVTFSTPTGVSTQNPLDGVNERNGDLSPTDDNFRVTTRPVTGGIAGFEHYYEGVAQ